MPTNQWKYECAQQERWPRTRTFRPLPQKRIRLIAMSSICQLENHIEPSIRRVLNEGLNWMWQTQQMFHVLDNSWQTTQKTRMCQEKTYVIQELWWWVSAYQLSRREESRYKNNIKHPNGKKWRDFTNHQSTAAPGDASDTNKQKHQKLPQVHAPFKYTGAHPLLLLPGQNKATDGSKVIVEWRRPWNVKLEDRKRLSYPR